MQETSHVYNIIEVAGSSTTSQDDALQNAIAKAATLYSQLDWYEVIEQRGHIENGKIAHYQVVVKIGYRLG